MGREDFSQSSQLTTLVGRPTNRYVRLPKNINTLRGLTDANKLKPNNRLHYSIYPSIAKEYEATYTQLTNLDFYSPVITILGNDPVSHLINTNYEDAGITVDVGSELVSTVSTVDTNTFGVYKVAYTATDGINPDTTVVRTVKVGLPPDVTINGQNPFNLEKFDVYVDSGVTINDSNSTLISTTSTVNNLTVGTYTVNYTVSNPAFTEVFSRTVRVDDTIPPVITIAGDNPYTLERFGVYTDPGATVDLGSELINTDLSNVTNTVHGTSFDVVYTAYDGNTTVTATRTVNVVDTIPPVITILGDDTYTLERFDVYTDEGATVDTGSILTTDISAVNNALTHGSSFVVTYTATDGNVAHDVTQTRTVNIVDTKPPVITLLGDVDPYQIQPLIPFQDVDPGFEVDLGTSVSVDYSNVVTTDNSNFDVVYRASDGVNPDTVVIRRVAVADTLSPVVILNGPSVVTLERYAEYVEQSVTLDLGSSLVSTITDLDNTTVGSYTVTYLATDNINPDTTNVRIINVVDTTAPIVTLNGASSVTLERYGVFADIDPGVTIDANGTLASVNISQLNNTTQGTYTVTYNVVDDHNNANVITREVVVEDTVPPVVTLNNESTSYTLERYGDWSAIDPGVTIDRGSYVDSVTVDNTSTGLKAVTYTVKDGTNTTVKNRVITVIDTIAPVGSISNPSYQLERFGVFNDPGVTDLDPGTYLAGTDTSNVDNTLSSGSTFDVIYDLGDGTSNTTLIRTVTVLDTTAPVITLINGDVGTTTYTVERGTTYVDPGATADTGETVTVNTSGLNMAVSDTYTVTYSATDADGNIGTASRIVIVDDTIAPVITLSGVNPYTVERGTTYIDPGATADTGETVTVNTSGLNMAVSDTYIVTYSATDADGNIGTESRIVIVDDTIAPVITLTNGDVGTTTYTVERGTTYVDPGATADTGETVTVNTSGLNMAVSDTYTVTYSATDADGNTGTASRTVIVEDNIAPVITLSGANPYTVERGTTYVDPGATADTGETVTVNTSGLNMAVSDTYTVTYSATDADGNIGTESRIVIVDDTIAPVITLSGANPYTVERGTTYVDPGATADTGETVTVNTSGLNMAVSDTYTVTYSATDADGNIGTESRIVIVDDTIAPVITLSGINPYTVERGTTYIDPGATADTGETVTVNTSGLNMAVSDTYIVTYSATDADGNIGTESRIVIVDDTIAPVITLSGANPYTVERGTTYVDPGATADTGETVTVNTSGLNMAVSDTYNVTYSATDADGNIGTESRTVIVDDTIAPVITLSGANPYAVERGTTYTDPGATADGGETVTVNTSGLNMAVSDTYTVIYSASDADGNIGTASRIVIVDDTIAPVITLSGANPYTVERGTTYVDPGATADTGETVTVNTSSLNMAVNDTYTVTYSATDADGNTGTASRTVIVDDVPVITLVGSNPFYQQNGFVYADSGASADGGETVITDYSAVNTGVNDTYTVYYSTDSILVGTATRTVNVGNYPTNLATTPTFYNIASSAVSSDGSVFVLGAGGGTSKAYYSNGTQKGGTLTALKSSNSGYSCDISANGNRIIIGEPNFFGSGGGNARVYDWNGSSWSTTDFGAPSGYSSRFTGETVAISDDGNTVLICDYNGTGAHIDSGWFYVARYNGSSWSVPYKVSGGSQSAYFGYEGDMSSDASTIVVTDTSSNAPIYTYRGTPGSYTLVDTISTGSYIRDNLSLSSDGNTLAANLNGTLRIYSWNPSGWTQLGLDIATSSSPTRIRLSGDGRRLVLGDRTYNSFQGISKVYEWTGLVWSQVGGNFIGSSNQELGQTVSVNYNGDRICISWRQGAKLEQNRSRI
jgi:hypothetical protein